MPKLLQYRSFLWGLLLALGFAPFHFKGLLLLGLSFFYLELCCSKQKFKNGLVFGIGLALFGLSWIYVSIHQYGHLDPIIASIITLLFILYNACFYASMAWCFGGFQHIKAFYLKPLFFAALWVLFEYGRAHLFGGFPWLLLGYASLDGPFAKILPYAGVYAASFAMVFCAASFAESIQQRGFKRLYAVGAIMMLIMVQYLNLDKAQSDSSKLEVAMIQGNASMPEKWDEQHFWSQFYFYQDKILNLLAPGRLIVLPEAAITAPYNYMQDSLNELNSKAKTIGAAILLGIPVTIEPDHEQYFNSLISLGHATGQYHKQQLVPFGEYIPDIWLGLLRRLNIPLVNTVAGSKNQAAIRVFDHAIASLICYELAYPERLRAQLPAARWIVSVSDDGWFGHSFALYQHIEMARVLSYMSQREQIFVNNNGLSSWIDATGQIKAQLAAWQAQDKIIKIESHDTQTPWMHWGDAPIMYLSIMLMLLACLLRIKSQRQAVNLTEWVDA